MPARPNVDADVRATILLQTPRRDSAIGFWPIERLDPDRWGGDPPVDSVEVLRRIEGTETAAIERVDMAIVPLRDAITWLAAPGPAEGTGSLAVVAALVRLATTLVAEARIAPGLDPTGVDAWQLRPDDALRCRLDEFARALPAEAWARPGRHDARSTVAEFADAVADAWVRTPGAAMVAGHDAFASWSPTVLDSARHARAFPVEGGRRPPRHILRLVAPGPGDDHFAAVLGLRARDRSATIDLATVWRAPERIRSRFDEVERDVLVTLRRAARVWPPIGRLLAQRQPDRLVLDDGEVEDVLGRVRNDLAVAGLSVEVDDELHRDLVLTPIARTDHGASTAPGTRPARAPRFDLGSVVELDWRIAIGGQALTEDERRELTEATRELVRFRGRWIHLDRDAVDRLRTPRTLSSSLVLAAAMGAEVDVDGQGPVVVEGPIRSLADRLRSLDQPTEAAAPPGFVGELRSYQRRGLAWLDQMTDLGLGGILADDMGLGKTIQVIALHLLRTAGRDPDECRPTLVICPASVVGNWEREVARFAPGVRTHRHHGQGRRLPDLDGRPDIVLTTYGVARLDVGLLGEIDWGLVIADEAQAIKNPRSRTAQALRRIDGGARLALTGTPVQNDLGDLWAILDWTTPGLLGPLERFRRDIMTPIERGDEEAAATFRRLVHPFVLRRTKSDPTIVPDLPPKTETDEIVPLTTEQAGLYQAVVDEVMTQIAEAEGIARRGLVLRLLTQLKQVCNHPEHFLAEGGPLAGRSGKLTAVTELLGTVRAEGDAALVFTQYVQMARLLERHLTEAGFRVLLLHGGLDLAARDDMVARFQAGEADVFLLSLRAGGTGLNLTRATHVVHYDRWWNPAVEDQASDRAWRIGQDRPVQVHRMICEGTIEDRIATLLDDKRRLAEVVVGSGEAWISELSDDELASLVALSLPEDAP